MMSLVFICSVNVIIPLAVSVCGSVFTNCTYEGQHLTGGNGGVGGHGQAGGHGGVGGHDGHVGMHGGVGGKDGHTGCCCQAGHCAGIPHGQQHGSKQKRPQVQLKEDSSLFSLIFWI